jgi:hypothetical protein
MHVSLARKKKGDALFVQRMAILDEKTDGCVGEVYFCEPSAHTKPQPHIQFGSRRNITPEVLPPNQAMGGVGWWEARASSGCNLAHGCCELRDGALVFGWLKPIIGILYL